MATNPGFILGVDLDGVVADFYGHMREIAAQWLDVPIEELPEEVTFGLPEWGLPDAAQYERLHRFAVTQRDLFGAMPPIKGASQALRRLSRDGVRIRIITHRLFIPRFHQTAVQQTIQWLDSYDVPYWDLCFMKDKIAVGADLYIEDSPTNIKEILAAEKPVIIYSHSTNRHLPDDCGERAGDWKEVERLIRRHYADWQTDRP